MKITDLDTKNVQVTHTVKRYILNDKVFELDGWDCLFLYASTQSQ